MAFRIRPTGDPAIDRPAGYRPWLVLMAIGVAALVFVAVAQFASRPSNSPLVPIEVALQTEQGAGCRGVGLRGAFLRGDPRDPRIVWLVADTGRRIDVIWPPGYRARFDPTIEILDGAGQVVLRDGDPVTGGCVTGNVNVLRLEPPFN